MNPRTIRSTAQRQILVWLRHGPSTVSEIAKQFSMRMPHASLACRQLREAGLVTRDERGGLRNAPIYMSQLGHERLEEDAVGKMLRYADRLRESQRPMVLHADETNVLIAYIEPPESSFVFVGEGSEAGAQSSSGNLGGAWVLADRDAVKWYTLTDGAPSTPPALRESNTLEAFESTQQRVGLVRGVVVEQRGQLGLVEGQAFAPMKSDDVPSPGMLSAGGLNIGNVPGLSGGFAPAHGLLAHLQSAAHRRLLVENLGQGAIAIGDARALSSSPMPYAVLLHWLKLKHPRMVPDRLEELYRSLVRELETIGTDGASPLRRALALDFGDQQWTREGWQPGRVSTHGVAERGVQAVLHHVMDEASLPFLLDWAFEPPASPVLFRWLTHPNCRAVVLRQGRVPEPRGGALLMDGQDLGTVDVQLSRLVRFGLNLHLNQAESDAARRPFSSAPLNAEELLAFSARHPHRSFSSTAPKGLAGERLSEAVRLFPEGNEERANAFEAQDPLAAWVASPPNHRAARWVRLKERLPDGWVELMPVHDVPVADLPFAMERAGSAWRRDALRRIQSHAAHDFTAVLRWRQHLATGDAARSAVATCMLCALDPLQSEHATAFEDASRVWFEAPMNEQEVLECLFGPARASSNAPLLQQWITESLLQPKGSILRTWAFGLGIAQRREPWLPETQRALMETLPARWWSVFAPSWLTAQLSSHTGRSWLVSFVCSWPALLARATGERSSFPGHLGEHAGFTLASTALLPVHLLPDGPGKVSLTDVYAMVHAFEQGAPVPVLTTHPSAGWLVRPVEQWPAFGREVMDVGDPEIGEVLFTRSFNARHQPRLR